MSDVPAGFRRLADLDEVISGFAPIYLRLMNEGDVAFGFRVARQHCNPRGTCHGGTWATVVDVLMGLNVGFATGHSGPTVSMAIDFIGAASIGQWVEGRARVLRSTPRLGFTDCLMTADGEPALRANAVFRLKNSFTQSFEKMLAPGA